MARYGIPATTRAFGVPVGAMQTLARQIGKDHALALELWESGWYEARVMAVLVDDPLRVSRKQMDAWAADLDNWGICDAVCFCLFDRSPFAWEKARKWASSPRELVKRAGFALMASLAGHDKAASDRQFEAFLPLIERGARDPRNFVKKGVSWALRRIGSRSPELNQASAAVARGLAASDDAACRWVGKDALRDFASPAARSRLARQIAAGRSARK